MENLSYVALSNQLVGVILDGRQIELLMGLSLTMMEVGIRCNNGGVCVSRCRCVGILLNQNIKTCIVAFGCSNTY